MARVAALIPDLLFGSGVVSALRAAGHDVVLCPDGRRARDEAPNAGAFVVDLTTDVDARLAVVSGLRDSGRLPRTLAFYAHVEPEVRDRASAAGVARAVPRSRMARDAAALVDDLLARD